MNKYKFYYLSAVNNSQCEVTIEAQNLFYAVDRLSSEYLYSREIESIYKVEINK